MTKIYLIHGWGGSPSSEGWFGWLKEESEKRDIELIIPAMPDTEAPIIEKWVNKLKEVVEIENLKDSYFIGHSIGCQAIMRYLESLDNPSSKGLIFIAPWMELDKNTIQEEGEETAIIAKPWMQTPINFEKIKDSSSKVLCLLSDNDPYVPLSQGDLFKKELNAEVIIKNKEGHFNTTQNIPEIINFIDQNDK